MDAGGQGHGGRYALYLLHAPSNLAAPTHAYLLLKWGSVMGGPLPASLPAPLPCLPHCHHPSTPHPTLPVSHTPTLPIPLPFLGPFFARAPTSRPPLTYAPTGEHTMLPCHAILPGLPFQRLLTYTFSCLCRQAPCHTPAHKNTIPAYSWINGIAAAQQPAPIHYAHTATFSIGRRQAGGPSGRRFDGHRERAWPP